VRDGCGCAAATRATLFELLDALLEHDLQLRVLIRLQHLRDAIQHQIPALDDGRVERVVLRNLKIERRLVDRSISQHLVERVALLLEFLDDRVDVLDAAGVEPVDATRLIRTKADLLGDIRVLSPLPADAGGRGIRRRSDVQPAGAATAAARTARPAHRTLACRGLPLT